MGFESSRMRGSGFRGSGFGGIGVRDVGFGISGRYRNLGLKKPSTLKLQKRKRPGTQAAALQLDRCLSGTQYS